MNLIEQHTALYADADIDYAQVLSGPYEDMSYIGDDAVVIAAQKHGKVTGFWRPMVAFGDARVQRIHIESLWMEYQDIVYEDYLIDGKLSPISTFLLANGYRADPHYVQVIDLRQSEPELRHDVRKSYRSLINKQDDVAICTVPRYRLIHEAVKGITRPDATWAIQERMSTVCACLADGSAGVMFYHGPVWSYYASAAGDNVHACVWKALMTLKDRGVQWCEMGEQKHVGTIKEIGISNFKAGFSGETTVRLILRSA